MVLRFRVMVTIVLRRKRLINHVNYRVLDYPSKFHDLVTRPYQSWDFLEASSTCP